MTMAPPGIISQIISGAGSKSRLEPQGILTDRYYLGYVKHNGIEHPGRHEALITEDLFDKVQKVLAANGHSGIRRRVHQHHLKGLLWCGRCRKRLVRSTAEDTVTTATNAVSISMIDAAGVLSHHHMKKQSPNSESYDRC
jgi:hypothetical protein